MRFVSLALVVVVAGCGSEQRTLARWRGNIDTLPNGIVRVTNPAEGIWKEKHSWRIREDLRIGRSKGPAPDVFSSVTALGVSPSGHIAVVDGPTQELRLFDSNGKHIRTLGRRGFGPAEFQRAHGLVWDRLGRLWVVDPANGRYTVFDSTGTFLFERTRHVFGVVYPWQGAFANDGYFYDVVGQIETDGRRAFIYFRVDTLGAIVDSLPKLEFRPKSPLELPTALFDLVPRLTFRFDPAGFIWTGGTDEYKIVKQNLTGDTLRIITRSFDPVHLTEQERDSLGRELAVAPAEFAKATIPETKPAFNRIFLQDSGFLFIQPMTIAESSGRVFDVFDTDGRYFGRASADVKFMTFPAPPIFTRDHVYGVVADSLGVQYVVRARIEK
jgi:6-bladed beta-propeller protein